MRLSQAQFVRMSLDDKQLLLKLAEREERTPSDVIRRLIRRAARNLNINVKNGAGLARPEFEVQDDRART